MYLIDFISYKSIEKQEYPVLKKVIHNYGNK